MSNIVYGVDADEAYAALQAAPIEDTQILTVTANSDEAQKAINIAMAAAGVLVHRIEKQQEENEVVPEQMIVLSIIDPASFAVVNKPNRERTILISAIAAFVLTMSAIIVFENSRRSS